MPPAIGFPPPSDQEELSQAFYRELRHIEYEIVPGETRILKWGVPDATRDHLTGEPVHDDLVISAALLAALEEHDLSFAAPPFIIHASDPLEELDKGW